MESTQKTRPNGRAIFNSSGEGLLFKWKESTNATETMAIYIESLRYDRNAVTDNTLVSIALHKH
jgi:hypothetical protein